MARQLIAAEEEQLQQLHRQVRRRMDIAAAGENRDQATKIFMPVIFISSFSARPKAEQDLP